MSQAKEGDKVKVHYTGTLDDGSVFDSSREREPLEFTIGQSQLLPAFEEAVNGLAAGETATQKIGAVDAYGERSEELVFEVEKTFLPEGMQPEVGLSLSLKKEDGSAMPVTISAVGEEKVTIDANHPLAGMDLTFEIELIEIGA